MAEHHVRVTIQTLQRRDGERDSMSQRAEGRLTQEGDGWLLTYTTQENGLATLTTLRLSGERATLTRSGAIGSQMVFQQGQTHTSLYETPYGKLPLSLHTQRLEWELEQGEGKIFLIYQLSLGGADMGETRLRLTVTKKAADPAAQAKETFL